MALSAQTAVLVLTRWHQLSVLFIVFFAIPSIVFGVIALFLFSSIYVSAFMIVIGIAYIFLFIRLFPSKDEVVITKDKMIFKFRDNVNFADIVSYGTEDYLKLVRRNGPTLIIQHTGTNREEYRAFCRQLVRILGSWRPNDGSSLRPVRKHFFGSLWARMIGLVLVAVSIGGLFIAFQLSELGIAGALLVTGLPLGLVLLRGKRPEISPDVAESRYDEL